MRVFSLPDPETTRRLGSCLASCLFPGAVIALVGQLGAGKTFLTRSIAEGLGIADSRLVTSPTFVLIQEHAARLPIYHFDAYRLPHSAAFADLGAHEYFAGDGVCLVEWADRVADCLPEDHLRIELESVGENSRIARVEGAGERHRSLARSLETLWEGCPTLSGQGMP